MKILRNSTLLFLIKSNGKKITDICLALKKRGFGMNRWNGVGGKVENSETIEYATKREAMEEIGVTVKDLIKVGELSFYFPHNSSWDQLVHIYFSENWEGELIESEEMKPEWFSVSDIPFKEMWSDDIYWLPGVLKGKLIRGSFIFGENDVIQNKEIKFIENF